MKKIVKRDGRVVAFNENKITNAIKAAARSVKYDGSEEEFEKLTDKAVEMTEEKFYSQDLKPTVEDIQDIVEAVLVKENLYEVAKAYILYREERTKKRERKSNLMESIEQIMLKNDEADELTKENGNVAGATPMGKMLKTGSESTKQFAHLYLLSDEASKAHLNGDIHIHDLDFYSTGTLTCCQIDLDKLFENGFNTGHGYIRTPNSIQSYASLACVVIQADQNDQHGGQAVPMWDYYLAPGVAKSFISNFCMVLDNRYDIDKKVVDEIKSEMRKYMFEHDRRIINDGGKEFAKELTKDLNIDFEKCWEKAYKLTEKDTYQSQQIAVHNLNSLNSRAGSQVPFSSLNFGTDTSEEGRLVSLNLLYATEDGLGNGETPIFPISILKVKKGVNYYPEDPNYDIFKESIKCSAKRLFPNFVNLDAPFNAQYLKIDEKTGKIDPRSEIATMGCRTRVIANNYDKTNETSVSRGNLSFTSINLPRLGIKAKGDINKFYKMLDEMLELVKNQLLDRMKYQGTLKVKNFPFLMGEGIWTGSEKLNPEDTLEEVIKQGTLGIGFIGLAETLVALTGKHHGESDESQKLGLEIVQHMRDFCDKACEESGLCFSLLATPAEGLAGRFVKMDRKRYGKIPGITNKEWYTNSSHVPVEYDCSIVSKVEKECVYHNLENGGHILYIEMDGDPMKNLDAFEKTVRLMCEKGAGYFAINHPVDSCPICGYQGIIDDECPCCGRHEGESVSLEELRKKGIKTKYNPDENGMVGEGIGFNRIKRITGYLVGTLDRFNLAKKAEAKARVHHGVINLDKTLEKMRKEDNTRE